MALFKVEVDKRVRKKDLPSIPAKDLKRVVDKIKQLAYDPYPVGVIRLKGRNELRIRQGNYQIIYVVEDKLVKVTVVKVGHRREVYD